MKIRAAVLRQMGAPAPYAKSQPLAIEEIDLDSPGQGEVLVRIGAAGLCHSDLSVINGDRPRPMPMALGHEAAGTIAGIGPGVEGLSVGDHVVMVFMPSCGHCLPCAEGRPALCEPGASANGNGVLLSGHRRLHCEGVAINHHLGCSAFADHAVVSQRSLVKIDKELPFPIAALFGCAVLTGVGAVINTAQLRAGQSAAVIGLGGVGLSALLGARAAGASRIVAIDISEQKLVLAHELGATETFNARDEDAMAYIMKSGGVNFAFEMAGSVLALETAFKITRRGGTTVTAGLPPAGAALAVDAVKLVAEERTLKGSYIGSSAPRRDIPRYIALYRAGHLPVDRLLSGILRLEDINFGFDRLSEGSATRQIIEF